MCSDVTAGAASGPSQQTAGLEIRLSIGKTQPLTGSASTSGKEPVSFVGWLEMLRVIADLTDATEQTDNRAPASGESLATQDERDRSLS